MLTLYILLQVGKSIEEIYTKMLIMKAGEGVP